MLKQEFRFGFHFSANILKSKTISFLFCVTVVKCETNADLQKTKLPPSAATSTSNDVKVFQTMTRTCDQQRQERFEDGMTTERVKCTSALSQGKWSREEQDCASKL